MKYKEPPIFLAFSPGVLRIEFNDPYLKDMLEADKVRTNFTCGTQIWNDSPEPWNEWSIQLPSAARFNE